jgi:hypothetical protein
MPWRSFERIARDIEQGRRANRRACDTVAVLIEAAKWGWAFKGFKPVTLAECDDLNREAETVSEEFTELLDRLIELKAVLAQASMAQER